MPTPFTTTYLRSPTIAQRVFGLDSPGQLVRSIPRTKFNFKAEFNLSAGAQSMLGATQASLINSSTGAPTSVAFMIKQIDKPRINLSTVELNQYNKKRIAYTKIEYGEASIRLHDSVNDSVLVFWINYFTYFFGDSRIKQPGDYTQSPVNPTFSDSSGWGFRPLSEVTQFFNSITVYAFFGQVYTSFCYINPKIISIDWQQKDYASSDPEEVTINFKYEAIQYQAFGQPSTTIDTGFTPNDKLDVPGIVQPSAQQALAPMIFKQQVSNFNFAQSSSSQSAVSPTFTNQQSVTVTANGPPPAIAPGASVPNSTLNTALTGAGTGTGYSAGSTMQFDPIPASNTGQTSNFA